MSVKCNVQERSILLYGRITNVDGQDDDWQLVRFELKDSDGSDIHCTVDLPPDEPASKYESANTKEWSVLLKAQTNHLGDVALCLTNIRVGVTSFELHNRS